MATPQTMSSMDKLLQEMNSEHSGIKFNTHQCRSLKKVCSIITEYLKLWKDCSQLQPPHLALRELDCLIHKAKNLVHLCKDEQSWLHNAAIRLNNAGEFVSICFGLSKLAGLINSQMILAAGDYTSSPEVQALISKPQSHQHLLFEDLESAADALNPALEVDKLELLLKARSLPKENMLRSYLLKKLDKTLPVLEPLELKDMIGGGAFGTVFKAEWMGLPVAVKEFREGDTSFDKEIKILKALMLEPNPNVLQIIGYYQKDDKAYLVMELMETDLARVIRKNHDSLQLRDMIDIMLQISSGMLYLHERDVVHRDLKPSNILVETKTSSESPDHACFNVRLTDFGFSRTNFVSFAPDLTYQRGTLLYMAPEMFRGQKYSREVDVYSFGVTCFQLLTRKLPFQENGQQFIAEKLVQMIEAGNRPDLPINCPKELAVLINRCWNTNPKDRPTFQNINRILTSLKDKLLLAHIRDDVELRDPAGDDLSSIAADLIEKICVTSPYTNVLQSNFIRSRCMQISGSLEAWNNPELPSGIVVMKKLVATLRSALSLIESYTKDCWLKSALIKLHNPRQFRYILEDIIRCTSVLELETRSLKDGKPVAHLNSVLHDPLNKTLSFLEQYAEDDKSMMTETAKDIVSGSLRASSGVSRKIAEYLVKKLTAQELIYVEPEDMVLQNVLGMSTHGAVFKASWLGTTVAVKRLRVNLTELLRARFKDIVAYLKNDHPNLISILGYTKHGEDDLLIFEYSGGGVLHLTGKPFPPLLAVEVLLQVAQGMQHLREIHLDLEDYDFNTGILIDFERSELEGFTGAFLAKISPYGSSLRPLKSQLKHQSVHRFGAACFEMITGKAIEADTFVSGRLPNLPPECPPTIQLMMKRCSSSKPPDFHEILETLRSAKMEMERNSSCSTGTDYRRMLLEMWGNQNEVNELELMGHGIVGEKLIVIVSMERAQNRLYQWVRQHRDGTIERLRPFLVSGTEFGTLEYTLTADDFDKAISLTFVDMNEKIEMGGRATTNSRWISCSDRTKRAIKNAWDAGEVKFRVTMHDNRKNSRRCYLVITRSYYMISWRKLLVKTIEEKTPFSSAACIRISQDGVCSLIDGRGATWNVRFRDSSTRDFAVLTFRHFAKMNSLNRRMNSRRI